MADFLRHWWALVSMAITVGLGVVYLEDVDRRVEASAATTDRAVEELRDEVAAVVGVLNDRATEERQWDAGWIDLDRNHQAELMARLYGMDATIEAIEAGLHIDSAILYRVGLRDGEALCNEGQP